MSFIFNPTGPDFVGLSHIVCIIPGGYIVTTLILSEGGGRMEIRSDSPFFMWGLPS